MGNDYDPMTGHTRESMAAEWRYQKDPQRGVPGLGKVCFWSIVLALLLLVMYCYGRADHHAATEGVDPALQSAIDGEHRSAEHKARDQYRHPAQNPDLAWTCGAGYDGRRKSRPHEAGTPRFWLLTSRRTGRSTWPASIENPRWGI